MNIASVQWNILTSMACLILMSAFIGQFYPQTGKKWYTPARLFIDVFLVIGVILTYACRSTFSEYSVSWGGFSILVLGMVLVSLFCYYVQKLGHKGLRLVFCFLLPLVIVIGFVSWVLESELEMQKKDRAYSNRFVSLSQDEKNKYFTSTELKDALGLEFPEFDVVKYNYNPQWQEWEKHIMLKFKRPLLNSSIEKMEQLCQSDSTRWMKKDADVYFYAPNYVYYVQYGDGWTIDVRKGIIKYDRDLH